MSAYNELGYAIFRNVIDRDLIAEASAHVDWLHARYPDRRGEELSHELVARDPFWVRLVSDDRLLDVAEQFIGPNIALFASHYISKQPFTGQPVLWHQDAAFWPLEPMEVVTLWLAVDHSTSENGCVRVIPGSHRSVVHDMVERHDVSNVLSAEIAVQVDESLAVNMELQPGDVEAHHPNIIHGSLPNTSPHRRCGLTIRYIPTSARITTPEQPFSSALLLRGEPGVNRYNSRPKFVPGDSFLFDGAEEW